MEIRDKIYGPIIVILIAIIGVQITDTSDWYYCEVESNLKECESLSRYGVENAKCNFFEPLDGKSSDICVSEGVKYPWKPMDDYVDISASQKVVVQSLQECHLEFENITEDIYDRCTQQAYNFSDCTGFEINGSCNDWNIISYETSCYIKTIIKEINHTICKPKGFNVSYSNGNNYEIIGDCCGYFNETSQIICKDKIAGICNPTCQQSSPDPDEYDEHCMIYDLLDFQVKPKMVGDYDYVRNNQKIISRFQVKSR